MLNKRRNLMMLISGIVLTIVGLLTSIFIYKGDIITRLSGLVFALGFGLIGGSLGILYKIRRIENTPGKSKQMEINYKDERNELIRDKAKAKAGEITNWFVILIAYICIVMGYPLWLVLIILGVFLLKYAIEIVFMIKYNKEF